MFNIPKKYLSDPFGHIIRWSGYDTACISFVFLSVGKESALRTGFVVLMLVCAFANILRSLVQASRDGVPDMLMPVVALGSALRLSITIVIAGLVFGVMLHGWEVPPAPWQSLSAAVLTVLIQLSGIALIVATLPQLWQRNRKRKLSDSIEIFKRNAGYLIAIFVVFAIFAVWTWALIQLFVPMNIKLF